MRCQQGAVLYLDLESRQYRVAERLEKLLKGQAPPTLHITHEAARIGSGLVEQLTTWCDGVSNPRLVIIDTLQKVKPLPKRGENAYDADYRILEGVQRFALTRGIAVVLVHHLKKGGNSASADPLERLSGSMGIPGTADTIYLLDGARDSKDATLSAEAREFERMSLAVRFEEGRWTCVGSDSESYRAEKAYRDSPIAQALLSLMASRQRWEGTARELVNDLYGESLDFPGALTPERLGVELSKLGDRLKADGITIERRATKARGKTVRKIIISRRTEEKAFAL